MKTLYTFEIHEEGLRNDGFYEAEKFEDVFHMLSLYCKGATNPVSVAFRKHEVEHDCDVCSSGSIKEEIYFTVKHHIQHLNADRDGKTEEKSDEKV